MAWMGWVQHRRERDWSMGEIFRLSQPGFEEALGGSLPRNRAGRNEAPSMMATAEETDPCIEI
jgi:hypothetical protein